jgi:mRNA interferase RelE/StbE
MKWRIEFSDNSEKFLSKNSFDRKEIFTLAEKAIRYFRGEDLNIDIRKLTGKWLGFYRIRKGKIRIIAEFNFNNSVVFIEEIDWRGNVYK